MTYLELVNSVLIRLREREVTAVTDNAYSKLIGQFVNDAKRQVEDAWNWNALRTTLTATTQQGIYSYELNTANNRFRILDVINDTSNWFMEHRSSAYLNDVFLNIDNQSQSAPRYYGINGSSSDGDAYMDIYPIPDGVYDVRINIVKPQSNLTADATQVLAPSEPIILGAFARAVAERGEDGGLSSAEATALASSSLSDHIAIEANLYPHSLVWSEV